MPDYHLQHFSVLVREFVDQSMDGPQPVIQVLRLLAGKKKLRIKMGEVWICDLTNVKGLPEISAGTIPDKLTIRFLNWI